jgi:tetratricopeptide (TPR) repeat protein
VLRADPNDQDARKNLSNALVGAAREAASFDRNAESASLFAEAIKVAPGRRLELAVEYANQLTYSDRAAKAVPLYREALQSGKLRGDQRRSAMLGLALALKWSGQPEEALDTYSEILEESPDTVEALVGRGSTFTQLDRNKEALADFDRAMELSPENREAIRDGAQALSFLGRQRMALERIAPLLGASADRQTRLIAARAELWKGRPDNAQAILQQMLDADPKDADALRIDGEIRRAQRPLSEVGGFVSNQNDGLVISGGRLRHGVSVNGGLGVIGAQFRAAILDPEEGEDVRLAGAGVFGRNRFNDMVEINGSLFLNRVETADETRYEPTYDAWLTVWPSDIVRIDISTSRSFFDGIETMEKNIIMETVGLSVDMQADPDLRLSGRGSYGFISDGNRRVFAQAEAERRVLRRNPGVFAGTRGTYTSFSQPELDNGYFNPAWMYSIEATLRAEWQPAPGWFLGAGANAGYEWQPDESKPIWGGVLSTSYVPNDSVSYRFDVSHQNSNLTGGSDAFIRTTVSGGLDIRW